MTHRTASSAKHGDMAILERVGSTTIVTLTIPELHGPDVATLLADLLQVAFDETSCNVILDLQNVVSVDSLCIGVLIESLRRTQPEVRGAAGHDGRRIALVNAAANVQSVFRLTSLDRLFPICRDVMSALSAVEAS